MHMTLTLMYRAESAARVDRATRQGDGEGDEEEAGRAEGGV
jgi:hypothetical protein